ncbi:MAG: hypothetical protein MZV70_42720 [Desulfobacterales bacterium]|nr:hypothetical protein [Desulfobacterales bacterium]
MPRARCFVAVDEGVLVKTGPDVLVSVRNAIARNGPRPTARGGGAGVPDTWTNRSRACAR